MPPTTAHPLSAAVHAHLMSLLKAMGPQLPVVHFRGRGCTEWVQLPAGTIPEELKLAEGQALKVVYATPGALDAARKVEA